MAIALVLDFPGATMEDYDEVVRRMELDGRLAPGGLFHAAGLYGDGLRVVDAWEDRDSFMAFADAKLKPITQDVGLSQPTMRMIDVDEIKPGSGNEPAFVQVVTLPGMDREKFKAADERILGETDAPSDVTFHVNGPTDGGWLVVDAWTSKEARDRFAHEHIAPAMADAGLTGPPVFEDLDVSATLIEPAKEPQPS